MFFKRRSDNFSAQENREKSLSLDYQRYLEAEHAKEKQYSYEKMCHFFGRFFKISLGKKIDEKLAKSIRIARLDITPQEIGGTFVITSGIIFFVWVLMTLIFPSPLRFLIWMFPLFWIYYVLSYAGYKAEVTRIQGSDAALRVILYMAMYLDMNPSLEGAVRNAARYTSGPLKDDLSKLLWDLEMGYYVNIKVALGHYTKLWREWSNDFVKALEYLVNSVSRVGDDRRYMIKKAQEYIIEATYNNMQRYSQNLKGPVTIIHMMGIVLPIMGLIMFPLISIFLHNKINPLYIVVGYIFIMPAFLFFLIHRQISKRPGAYSHPSIGNIENLPPKDKLEIKLGKTTIFLPLLPTAILLTLIIILPGLFHFFSLANAYIFYAHTAEFKVFMTQRYQGTTIIKDMFQAFTVFWGFLAGLVVYFVGRSYKRKKIREIIEQIESGLDLGLTELENSLSKNIPMERSLYDVVEEYEKIGEENSPMHNFFAETLRRVQQMSMPIGDAIFSRNGSIKNYPSALLQNVMRIITNSIVKGHRALINTIRTINDYIQNNSRIERLIKNLLDEVLGSMKMLAIFIAPIMCSMAATIGTMILKMLYQISVALKNIEERFGVSSGFVSAHNSLNQGPLAKLTQFDQIMPPTVTMIIIGIYLIEVTLILAYFLNGVENGFDEINRDMTIGKFLLFAGAIFTVLVIGTIIIALPFIENLSKF